MGSGGLSLEVRRPYPEAVHSSPPSDDCENEGSYSCISPYVVTASVGIYRVAQKECARLRESVPYVKLYRYNPKHLYPKLNGYGDNGQRSLKL